MDVEVQIATYVRQLLDDVVELKGRVTIVEILNQPVVDPPLLFSTGNKAYTQTINYPTLVSSVNSAANQISAIRVIPDANSLWIPNPKLANKPLTVDIPSNVAFPRVDDLVLVNYMGNLTANNTTVGKYAMAAAGAGTTLFSGTNIYTFFTPAGSGHFYGLVPDPGPTLHYNPYYLGDDAKFHPVLGGYNLQNGPTYTATVTDRGKLVEFSNVGTFTFNLLLPSTLTQVDCFWFVDVQNGGPGTAVITCPTSCQIEGFNQFPLNVGQGLRIFCDGTNYWTMRGRYSLTTTKLSTTNYTIQQSDYYNMLSFSSSNSINITIPTPTASTYGNGFYFDIQNTASSYGLVLLPTACNIDNNSSLRVPISQGCRVFSDGTNYYTQRGMSSGTAIASFSYGGVNHQTATYTISQTDKGKLVTYNSSIGLDAVFPQAGTTGIDSQWFADVENYGTGLIQVVPVTSAIDSFASTVLFPNQGLRVFSDNANYYTERGKQLDGITLVTGVTTYTVQLTDYAKLISCNNTTTPTPLTVSLPTATSSTFAEGWFADVQSRGVGFVYVQPVTSTIDGTSVVTVGPNLGLRVFSDGINYYTQRGMSPSAVSSFSYGQVNEQTTNYNVAASDKGKLVTFTNSQPLTATLPQAGTSSIDSLWFSDIENYGTNAILIQPTTSDIDGDFSVVLFPNQGLRVFSDNTNYFTQRGKQAGGVELFSGTTIYTPEVNDFAQLLSIETTAGSPFSLPLASPSTITFADGWFVDVQNTGGSVINIEPVDVSIDALDNVILYPDQGIRLFTDGANYFTERGKQPVGVTSVNSPSYTVKLSDFGRLISTNPSLGNPYFVTIPTATSSTFAGDYVTEIENMGSGLTTLEPNSGTIDGQSALNLFPNQGVRLFSDGNNWFTQRGKQDSGFTVVTTTSTYVLQLTDFGKTVKVTNTNTIPFAVSLPTPTSTTYAPGYFTSITNSSSVLLMVKPVSATIDGQSSIPLYAQQAVKVVSDGTNYYTERGKQLDGVTSVTGVSTYVPLASDYAKLISINNASTVTAAVVSLPTAAATTLPSGWFTDVEAVGLGYLQVIPVTSSIDNTSVVTIPSNCGLRIFSDGTNYWTQRGISSSSTITSYVYAVTATAPIFATTGSTPVISSLTNTVNGLLKLDGTGLAPTAQLGTGTANGSTVLLGNQTYALLSFAATIGGIDHQTATYTISSTDRSKLVTFTSSLPLAAALPQAGTSGIDSLWYVDVENYGTGVITLLPTTSSIDSLSTLVLFPNQGCRVFSDDSNYYTQRGRQNSGVTVVTGVTTYVPLITDYAKLISANNAATATPLTISLPTATSTSYASGWFADIQASGVGFVDVVPITSTIDGTSVVTITPSWGLRVFSDGSNYYTQRGMASSAVTATAPIFSSGGPYPVISSLVNTANGLLKLDSNNFADPTQLGSGTYNGSTVLLGNQTYAAITIPVLTVTGTPPISVTSGSTPVVSCLVNTVNGLLKLDGGGLAPTAQLGSGTANGSTVLLGNQTYAALSSINSYVVTVSATPPIYITAGSTPTIYSLVNTINGLLKLDSGGLAPTAQLGGGTASSSTVLFGNQTYGMISGGGGGGGLTTIGPTNLTAVTGSPIDVIASISGDSVGYYTIFNPGTGTGSQQFILIVTATDIFAKTLVVTFTVNTNSQGIFNGSWEQAIFNNISTGGINNNGDFFAPFTNFHVTAQQVGSGSSPLTITGWYIG